MNRKSTDLLVSSLRLGDSTVIVVPDGDLSGEALVNGGQTLREDV